MGSVSGALGFERMVICCWILVLDLVFVFGVGCAWLLIWCVCGFVANVCGLFIGLWLSVRWYVDCCLLVWWCSLFWGCWWLWCVEPVLLCGFLVLLVAGLL